MNSVEMFQSHGLVMLLNAVVCRLVVFLMTGRFYAWLCFESCSFSAPNSICELEIPRGSDKTFSFFSFFFKRIVSFPLWFFHKYVPPLLASVSVGKPDGNFITRTDQTMM